MGQAAKPPLSIWAVSDGRAGIEAQALGLADAVARLRPAEVEVKRIRWKWGVGRLPSGVNPALAVTLATESPLAAPWPDIWIAAGRATLPLSNRMHARSGGRTFVVQTQDPRGPLEAFDMVVPPSHDDLAGPKVFPIVGAPNRLTPQRLAEARAHWKAWLDPLPRPRVAVIVGGKSRAFDLPEAHAEALARQIGQAITEAGGALLLSFTRRTPEPARRAMTGVLRGLPGIIWDGRGENPYFAFLADADVVLVTEDSTNLATDAATAGKPVHVLPLPGGSAKFTRFHEELRARGAARPFDGRIETWAYSPFVETDRAAAELLRRYDARLEAARKSGQAGA